MFIFFNPISKGSPKEILSSAENILQEMVEGEVRILSI